MNLSMRFSIAKQKKHVIAGAVTCGVLLAVPACQIPKLRHAEQGPGLPGDFTGPINPAPGPLQPAGATGSEPVQPAGFKVANGSEPARPAPAVGASGPAPDQQAGTKGATGAVQPAGLKGAASAGPVQQVDANGTPVAENSAQLGIEEFFHDPLLTGLIDQALVGNRELKILEEEAQVARNEILARRGAYLPFVTVGASAGLERPSRYTRNGAVESQLDILPGVPFPEPLPNFATGLNFIWTPDIWRQLRNARDAAGQRYIAAVERRNFFVTRMVAEIAENYYRLMALDKRMENLDQTITLQEQSLEVAKAKKAAGFGTELAVQRFQAEVQRNQSDKLIVRQEIIEVENRINYLVNRYPEPVARASAEFFDLTIHSLSLGVPAQLLQNRPDIRQAERELAAAGLDVKVARARFYPAGAITAGIGYEAFHPKYLFRPEALAADVAGSLVAPLINKMAIQADYLSANARQLQSVYNYQRVILNAFTEVVNRMSMVENYRKSIDIKKQQLASLEASVESSSRLFQAARAEYIEVLFSQRDLRDARMVLIDTKRQQLAAVVNTYQALGGGDLLMNIPPEPASPDALNKHGFRSYYAAFTKFCQGSLRQMRILGTPPASTPPIVPSADQAANPYRPPILASVAPAAESPMAKPASTPGSLPMFSPVMPAGPANPAIPSVPTGSTVSAGASVPDAAAPAKKAASNGPIMPE